VQSAIPGHSVTSNRSVASIIADISMEVRDPGRWSWPLKRAFEVPFDEELARVFLELASNGR